MCWQHYLENKKPTFLLVFLNKFMLPFWNLQNITIFFRTAKSTLAGSLKCLWHAFCKTVTVRKKRRQAKLQGICFTYHLYRKCK